MALRLGEDNTLRCVQLQDAVWRCGKAVTVRPHTSSLRASTTPIRHV